MTAYADDRVSVVIPAYNSARFVGDAVRSALAQTRPPAEVIVVDDGSQDDTASVASAVGPSVRVLRQANAGVGAARNAGWRAARSPWVAFLDADDRWHPSKLELQQRIASRAPWSYTARRHVGDFEGIEYQVDMEPVHEGDVFERLLVQGNFVTLSSVLIRREILEAHEGFSPDPAIAPCEDWDLWIRVSAVHPVAMLSDALVEYRLHETNASRNAARMNRARARVLARALALPRGRALSAATRRRATMRLHVTNSWQCRREANWSAAVVCGLRGCAAWPFSCDPVLAIGRALARRK